MEIFQIVVLALIQGITEFLPISSSAHLILPKEVLGWPDQGLAFDVAVHIGSLSAVMIYFRKDIGELIQGWLASVFKQQHSDSSRLAWFVFFATIPTGLAGLLFKDFIEAELRSMQVIMVTTIFFGLYLWIGDSRQNKSIPLVKMTLTMALIIGFSQALALIPGTSRSGVTIATALLLGLHREASARFSFLLSIPIILLTGLLAVIDLIQNNLQTNAELWRDLFLGTVIAGVSAYVCIHYFLRFIQQIGMLPFVIYRLVLGGLLALLIFAG